MDVQALTEEYRQKTEEELLRLLFDQQQLTDDARVALQSEISARGLSREKVEQFRSEEQERRQLEKEQEKARSLQRIKYRYVHYGKADREYNPESNLERYTTTYYWNILRLPIVPVGTYRVQRKRSWLTSLTVLEKLPLNWDQVLAAWVVGAGVLLVLIWTFKLLRYFLLRNP